MWYLFL